MAEHLFAEHLLEHKGVHQRSIYRFFKGLVKFNGTKPVFNSPLLVLAFTNRCGSNLTADRLRSTGLIRGLNEQLNAGVVEKGSSLKQITDFPTYIQSCVARQAHASCVFGVKASFDQLLMIWRWRITEMFSSLIVIHVERRDIVAQSVSFSIASQTKRWTSKQIGVAQEPVFLQGDISRRLDSIARQNKGIELFCNVTGVRTRKVFYEDIVTKPKEEVEKIAETLGLDLTGWTPSSPSIEKQGTSVNGEFVSMYRKEMLDRLRAPDP